MPFTDVLPELKRSKRSAFQSVPESTRRVYDFLAGVYPVSTMLFHSKAHKAALSLAGIESGMRVLEVATGSGEMFERIMRANPEGMTCGIDLAPNMAAKTQRIATKRMPDVQAHCQVVDARSIPFRDGVFDAVVSCYMLELLAEADIVRTMREMHRVLRPGGRMALVLIGQHDAAFNVWYRFIQRFAHGFLGPQMESAIPDFMAKCDFKMEHDLRVWQTCYPSRVVVARK
jgi:ubiquinone/menaquinone biosynthesis C-methylase UbiE